MITCFREWPSDSAAVAADEASDLLPAGERRWYNSGRAALHDALARLVPERGAEVWMPAYIAAGVIEPVRRLGLAVRFYGTGENLILDEDALAAELEHAPAARALVVLHPMGRAQPLERLAKVCRDRGILLIEDCAQGLFSRRRDGEPLGARGDLALFSLPKFLGVVDGAILVARGRAAGLLQEPRRRPIAVRAAGAWHRAHLLANRRLHADAFPALDDFWLELGSFCHERYYALAGADFRAAAPAASTLAAWRRLDAADLVRRRRANIDFLYKTLKTDALRLLYPNDNPGWVPLAVPAFARGDRTSIQRRARGGGVFLATLLHRWDYLPPDPAFAGERRYLDGHVLIPINEHIDSRRMERLVKTLNELRK